MELDSPTAGCKSASPVKMTSMQGATGDYSYARNSTMQSFHFHAFAKPHLAEALDHVCCNLHSGPPRPSTMPASSTASTAGVAADHVAIADLGCSHGPNTLDYACFIRQGLRQRLKKVLHERCSPPEMLYFFSDLPCNDFNSLFQSLQPYLQMEDVHAEAHAGDAAKDHDRHEPPMKFFAAGVPGSFHGRLFPKKSLHLVISSHSLHWLSQVPPDVMDRASPAWNGGHIWIHGERPKVAEAYACQFQMDVKGFLESRVQELVTGGILFLMTATRIQEHPTRVFFNHHHDLWLDPFDSTWEEMVSEGLVSVQERDMFNLPFYNFHASELEAALEGLSGELELVKMEVMSDCSNFPEEEAQRLLSDPEAFGKLWTSFIASLAKPMVEAHLGEARAEDMFRRLQRINTKRASLATSMATSNLLFAIIRRR